MVNISSKYQCYSAEQMCAKVVKEQNSALLSLMDNYLMNSMYLMCRFLIAITHFDIGYFI